MRQMLDTRSSAASATQLSRLCKPSSEKLLTTQMGECTRIWAYRPVLMICFLSKQFSSKGKSMNLYEQKFGNPQRVPCPDVVTVFRQKKAEHSVTDNVVWRAFLKHRAASPASPPLQCVGGLFCFSIN